LVRHRSHQSLHRIHPLYNISHRNTSRCTLTAGPTASRQPILLNLNIDLLISCELCRQQNPPKLDVHDQRQPKLHHPPESHFNLHRFGDIFRRSPYIRLDARFDQWSPLAQVRGLIDIMQRWSIMTIIVLSMVFVGCHDPYCGRSPFEPSSGWSKMINCGSKLGWTSPRYFLGAMGE